MSEPRVVIAMAHTSDYTPLASLTVPTVRAYAEKHGYSFYYHPAWEERFQDDGDRMKVRIYKELYEARDETGERPFDVYFWIDSDAMITNSDMTVNQFLEDMMVTDREHFIWGCDPGGPNSGVYLARFTPEAHMFMHAQFMKSMEMGWGDNTAMNQTSLLYPHNEVIRCVPGLYLNAYDYDLYGWPEYKYIGDWQTARNAGKDFIMHFPGIETFPNPDHPDRPNRMEQVQKYLKLCK